MKKHLSKITSFVLSLVIIFSGIFSIIVSADTTELPKKCLEDHFSNLNTGDGAYVPVNIDGSCGYVAMSMLLTYLDTYWHDDIVDENIEWDKGVFDSSTGELTHTVSSISEYNSWIGWRTTHPREDVLNFELANQNNYLQYYLTSLGKFSGYHPDIADENDTRGFGINSNNLKNILDSYLHNIRNFSENEIEVHIQNAGLFDLHQEELNQTIIEQIEKGYPVIYFGTEDNNQDANVIEEIFNIGEGHFMIAYGVTKNGDIKLHNGWNSDSYSTVNTTSYQYNNIAIWVEIKEENLPHECSNNYLDTSTQSYVCACNIYHETHPSHVHFHYDSYDNTSHFGECICGNVIQSAPHDKIYKNITSAGHYEDCRGCNYYAFANHNCESYISGTSKHQSVCSCGYVIENVDHFVSSYEQYTNTLHKTYCICGHYIGTETHSMVTSGRYATCTDCGVVVDTFFIPVIKGIEENYDIE